MCLCQSGDRSGPWIYTLSKAADYRLLWSGATQVQKAGWVAIIKANYEAVCVRESVCVYAYVCMQLVRLCVCVLKHTTCTLTLTYTVLCSPRRRLCVCFMRTWERAQR